MSKVLRWSPALPPASTHLRRPLAKRGYDLILVARRVDRLRILADKIAGETGRKVEVIAADLGKRKDLAKVEAVLRTETVRERLRSCMEQLGLSAEELSVAFARIQRLCDELGMEDRVRASRRR